MTEKNHLGGLRRGPKLPFPISDHRVFTAIQQHCWPERLMRRDRSPEDEIIATMLGIVSAQDLLGDAAGGLRIDIPPGTTTVQVNLADVPGYRHVYGTDRAWHRQDMRSPWIPIR